MLRSTDDFYGIIFDIMDISKKTQDGRLVLSVSGRLDTTTAPQLEAEIPNEGVCEVEFDFSSLEYMSSAGLRVLIKTQKAMNACGGKMIVAHPNATVKTVLDITGCSGIVTIV